MNFETTDIQIFKTYEYSGFKKLAGNRSIKQERVSAIMDSIKKVGYQPVPILVNEKFEIIDGQGRHKACEIMSLPIYFEIKAGIGIEECIAMNIKMKNWDIYDFISSYASQGNRNYQLLEKYCQEVPNLTSIEVAMCLSDANSKNIERPLRAGTFAIKVGEDNMQCLKFMREAKHLLSELKGGSNYYFPVLLGLYKFNLIDEERMLNSLKANKTSMISAYNIEVAISELQKAYNFRKRHNEYFRDKYLQIMEAKGARYGRDN